MRYRLVTMYDCPHCARVMSILARTSANMKIPVSVIVDRASFLKEFPTVKSGEVPILQDLKTGDTISKISQMEDMELAAFFEELITQNEEVKNGK